MGRLFGYGDLIIETAGAAQPIRFPSIRHPMKAQRMILQYMDGLTERERAEQQAERQRELVDWLDAYRELMFPPCDPPVCWPDQAAPTRHGR